MTRSRKMLWALAIVVVGYLGVTSLPSGADMLSGARSTRGQVADLRGKIDRVDDALGDASGFAERLAASRVAVPVEPRLPELIAALDAVVASAGFEWASASPSPEPAAVGDGQSWSMGLTLFGSPDDLPELLSAIAAMDRLVVVDSLQLRGSEPATVSMTIRFFTAEGEPASFESVTTPAAGEPLPSEGQ